jgi:hypothetical protein
MEPITGTPPTTDAPRLSRLGAPLCNREHYRPRVSRGAWTNRERAIVIAFYPDYKLLKEKLPGRTYDQIRNYAHFLGIRKKKHVWTTGELRIVDKALKELWSKPRLHKALLHLAPRQIYAQCARRGSPAGPKLLGTPLQDDIRAQARAMNLSLRDLDEICGGKLYWQRSIPRPWWRKCVKVVKYMGGQMRAEFKSSEA